MALEHNSKGEKDWQWLSSWIVPRFTITRTVPIYDYKNCPPIYDYNNCLPIYDYKNCPPIYDYNNCPPIYDYKNFPPIYDYKNFPPIYDYKNFPYLRLQGLSLFMITRRRDKLLRRYTRNTFRMAEWGGTSNWMPVYKNRTKLFRNSFNNNSNNNSHNDNDDTTLHMKFRSSLDIFFFLQFYVSVYFLYTYFFFFFNNEGQFMSCLYLCLHLYWPHYHLMSGFSSSISIPSHTSFCLKMMFYKFIFIFILIFLIDK